MLIEALTVLNLTNDWRLEQGLSEWQSHSDLIDIAHNRWLDMCADDYFAHQDESGHNWLLAVAASPYDYQVIAENLALGQRTPEGVLDDWLNSPPHHDTIAGDYLEVGIYSGECQIKGKKQNLTVEIAAKPRSPVSTLTVAAKQPASEPFYRNLLNLFFGS